MVTVLCRNLQAPLPPVPSPSPAEIGLYSVPRKQPAMDQRIPRSPNSHIHTSKSTKSHSSFRDHTQTSKSPKSHSNSTDHPHCKEAAGQDSEDDADLYEDDADPYEEMQSFHARSGMDHMTKHQVPHLQIQGDESSSSGGKGEGRVWRGGCGGCVCEMLDCRICRVY